MLKTWEGIPILYSSSVYLCQEFPRTAPERLWVAEHSSIFTLALTHRSSYLHLLRKLANRIRESAVQIGTLIKAYLILLIQPLVNVLRMFDLDSDSSNGLPENLHRNVRCVRRRVVQAKHVFLGQRSFRKPHE